MKKRPYFYFGFLILRIITIYRGNPFFTHAFKGSIPFPCIISQSILRTDGELQLKAIRRKEGNSLSSGITRVSKRQFPWAIEFFPPWHLIESRLIHKMRILMLLSKKFQQVSM